MLQPNGDKKRSFEHGIDNLLDVVQQTLGKEFGFSPTMNRSPILK